MALLRGGVRKMCEFESFHYTVADPVSVPPVSREVLNNELV